MAEQSQPPFHTEGILSGTTAAGALLADGGAMSEGSHTFAYICGANVAGRVRFVWKDTNGAAKHTQPIFLTANGVFMHSQPSALSIPCAEGDRFVLETDVIIVGGVQGSLCVA